MQVLPPHNYDNPGPLISFIVRQCEELTLVPRHSHMHPQLLYTTTGFLQVHTDGGDWVVPNGQAFWLPAGVPHDVKSNGIVTMHSLFFNTVGGAEFLDICSVVTISPLLRELILYATRSLDTLNPAASERLISVILDQVNHLPAEPLFLPVANDSRLKPIIDRLLDDPSDSQSLDAWADEVGSCSRTLSRLFVTQTGLSFGSWRERARVMAALKGLSEGRSVTEMAYELGYRSQSAFISMFKRTTGRTPGKFFTR
ncbi:AraC family transcriptional regulator [Pontivivens nitratireducens]|uniref:AraC family transcriptional regulator n=1 Tax=Pontivivens nitratireducens TaxID=2758038 RepID=UPI001639BC32|nr:helix-turn-helix transcriptional regulator [Pontibrevibacter nitratireducens]